jgi:hypothetical protein
MNGANTRHAKKVRTIFTPQILVSDSKKKMIGGLFYTDDLIAISQENERRYTREEINQRCVHLETWLRSSGWTYLNLALCRRRKKGIVCATSCLMYRGYHQHED